MSAARHRLIRHLPARREGVAYVAHETHGGEPFEVRHLGGVRLDAVRWAAIRRRVQLTRLVAHPAVRRIVHDALDGERPFVAVELVESTLVAGEPPPWSSDDVRHVVAVLADALAALHRVGLAGFDLDAQAVGRRADGTPVLDALALPDERDEDAAADVARLADLARYLLGGRKGSQSQEVSSELTLGMDGLLSRMRVDDAAARPSAAQVAVEAHASAPDVERTHSTANLGTERGEPSPDVDVPPAILGRFRIHGLLGEGGMGRVYRAEDLTDGSAVAVKVLSREMATSTAALRRFEKEARMLAELDHAGIARFVELNHDAGHHYLVMELVEGVNLRTHLARVKTLPEREALEIVADVARALADVHGLGIVHRDIKPSNIMLVPASGAGDGFDTTVGSAHDPGQKWRAKLLDFGIARQVDQSQSLEMTRAGVFLGSPSYTSPEQCLSGVVDARSDIYALGVSLYQMLAGRPPFTSEDIVELITSHLHKAPEPLAHKRPELSDATCELVARMLEKSPDRRPGDARELLEDVERALGAAPGAIDEHPARLSVEPDEIVRHVLEWDLTSSPETLWPHVSNTERLNRALGLAPASSVVTETTNGDVRTTAKSRVVALDLAWREHPYEWIEPRRLGVVREYSSGPMRWLRSVVELLPGTNGGTRLRHTLEIVPNGLVGRAAVAVEGLRARRALERVYRRIDETVQGRRSLRPDATTERPSIGPDPFEGSAPIGNAATARLRAIEGALVDRGIEMRPARALIALVETGSAQEIGRIRPLSFANRVGLDPAATLVAFLAAAREGLLELYWDLVCPVCRIATVPLRTLRDVGAQGNCAACDLEFAVDLASSVEMVFRAHPQIRKTDDAVYCIGSPAHSPHVAAQVSLRAGERLELSLSLPEGSYRIAGRRLTTAWPFRVEPGAPSNAWEISLAPTAPTSRTRVLRPGHQRIVVTNDQSCAALVRIERAGPRDDAFTAARAAAFAPFRELYGREVLGAGQLVTVTRVTLLATDLGGARAMAERLGDDRAFALLHDHFRRFAELVEREGGAVVKIHGDGVLASFVDPESAVRAALGLGATLPDVETSGPLHPKAGVHTGPAMVATLNDRLDYFGSTVRVVRDLVSHAGDGELLSSDEVAFDPMVRAALSVRGVEPEPTVLPGLLVAHAIKLATPG